MRNEVFEKNEKFEIKKYYKCCFIFEYAPEE